MIKSSKILFVLFLLLSFAAMSFASAQAKTPAQKRVCKSIKRDYAKIKNEAQDQRLDLVNAKASARRAQDQAEQATDSYNRIKGKYEDQKNRVENMSHSFIPVKKDTLQKEVRKLKRLATKYVAAYKVSRLSGAARDLAKTQVKLATKNLFQLKDSLDDLRGVAGIKNCRL